MSELEDFVVFQITARMRYSVARSLEKNGRLRFLVTDLYFMPRSKFIISRFRTLVKYLIPVSSDKIKGSYIIGIIYRLLLKFSCDYGATENIFVSRLMYFRWRHILNDSNIMNLYTFDIHSKEIIQHLKRRSSKVRIILEQCVAPRMTQLQLLESEFSKLSKKEYERRRSGLLKLIPREHFEWQFSDLILCPSPYVHEQLIKCGVPSSKLIICEYGVALPDHRFKRNYSAGNRLTCIFVGTVEYRKGISTLIDVASQTESFVDFVVIGDLSRTDLSKLDKPRNIKFFGKLDYADVIAQYEKAQLFVFPSLLEGSATVTYEALSFGLPVIASFQSGSVVTNGVDGFIVDARDARSIVALIRKIFEGELNYHQLSTNAVLKANLFSEIEYEKRLKKILL